MFFRVALGSIITIRRFNFTLARTTWVIRHADCSNIIWCLVKSVWWWWPRRLAHKKIEVLFCCKVERKLFRKSVFWFYLILPRDWSRKFALSGQPIRCKTKKQWRPGHFQFSALEEVVCPHFELSLANDDANLRPDWPLGVEKFKSTRMSWESDSQLILVLLCLLIPLYQNPFCGWDRMLNDNKCFTCDSFDLPCSWQFVSNGLALQEPPQRCKVTKKGK